ncbi:MAG: ATP-binding protein [Dehalococcoidia bacterium]|jgi:two-component system phosphate regulon sensor histidine kinase PhoR
MDIGLLILIVFLSSAVLLFIAVYLFGYRLTRKGRNKPADGPVPSTISTDTRIPAVAVIRALSEIDDGVLIINENYQVSYMNNAAMKIFDILPGKWNAQTFIEVVRDHECDALLKKSVNTNEPQFSLIRTHQMKQLLSVSVFPSEVNDSYIVIVKDLTERQRIEQIRKDLVSNIAHEFRTPIASIRLLAETLQQGAINDPKVSADFLSKIDVESVRLQQMTDDLNQLSLIESDGLPLEREAADVGRLIKQTVERLRAQAGRKGISIIMNIEPGMPRPVVDKNGIESVLMNLVHNGIKYTDTTGQITVNARRENDTIRVSVTDTGIGISSDELPRIFERFYKVDKSRNTEGSGLGLAISKHIIASHGGKIWAESVEGKGSTFCFTLPLPA